MNCRGGIRMRGVAGRGGRTQTEEILDELRPERAWIQSDAT